MTGTGVSSLDRGLSLLDVFDVFYEGPISARLVSGKRIDDLFQVLEELLHFMFDFNLVTLNDWTTLYEPFPNVSLVTSSFQNVPDVCFVFIP